MRIKAIELLSGDKVKVFRLKNGAKDYIAMRVECIQKDLDNNWVHIHLKGDEGEEKKFSFINGDMIMYVIGGVEPNPKICKYCGK